VPASIYRGSYPLRVFARDEFLARVPACWSLVDDAPAPEGGARSDGGLAFEYRYLQFVKTLC
jgi:hypothetical protein